MAVIVRPEGVLFREEIQFLKKSEETEPPYGVLLITAEELVLVSEGEKLDIPLKAIKSMEIGYKPSAGDHSLFSKTHISIKYREGAREYETPPFSAASGLLGATLSGARDKRTQEVYQEINRHLSKYSKGGLSYDKPGTDVGAGGKVQEPVRGSAGKPLRARRKPGRKAGRS